MNEERTRETFAAIYGLDCADHWTVLHDRVMYNPNESDVTSNRFVRITNLSWILRLDRYIHHIHVISYDAKNPTNIWRINTHMCARAYVCAYQAILEISLAYLDQANIHISTFAKKTSSRRFDFLLLISIFDIFCENRFLIYFTWTDVHAISFRGTNKMNIH